MSAVVGNGLVFKRPNVLRFDVHDTLFKRHSILTLMSQLRDEASTDRRHSCWSQNAGISLLPSDAASRRLVPIERIGLQSTALPLLLTLMNRHQFDQELLNSLNVGNGLREWSTYVDPFMTFRNVDNHVLDDCSSCRGWI